MTTPLPVEPALAGPPSTEDWSTALEDAVTGTALTTVFQPVVDLRRLTIVGYEALSRFSSPHVAPCGPDRWFEAAREMGAGAELGAATLRSAFAHRPSLPRNCFLSVNLEPGDAASPVVRDVVTGQGDLTGVVLELTEHTDWSLDDIERPMRLFTGQGALLALDDAGAGYSGLQKMLHLRPSILKLDRELISGIDHDEARLALVEMLGTFASRIDAWILAEGIETVGEARRLADLGVPLVQGYYFGRPAPPWADLPAEVPSELGFTGLDLTEGLHLLVDPAAPLHHAAVGDGAEWLDASDPWRVVVDADRRPLGLLTDDSLAIGELVPTLVANVHSSPAQVATRLATDRTDPHLPVIATDDRGAYLGIVTLRRLLAHLGT